MDVLTSAIFGGFISKIINDITDVSNIKNKIINAVKNKKNKHQNSESQIYNIIVDVLNEFTYNKYKNNQNKIYDVAEALIIGFLNDKIDDVEVISSNLHLFPAYDEYGGERFKGILYQILSSDNYSKLYREIRLMQEEKESDKTSRIEQTIYDVKQRIDEIKYREKKYIDAKEKNKVVTPKSRTQYYLDVWNKNMFLNNFTEWDEKRGENVRLSDVYIKDHLPHFLYGENLKEYDNIDVLLSQYIMKNNDDNKMLLILGQPGIGKSTLITWMLNNYKDRINDILVYQFASDLKDVPWGNFTNGGVLIDELGLFCDDLEGKILILDGFDEINIKKNKKDILDIIYGDLIYKNNIKNFTLIITCRENYIKGFERLSCKYITLQPWDERQIEGFCKVYCEKGKFKISNEGLKNIINNKTILGIPLILYMVLALEINCENESSIVSVYDKIFSLDGGIYDRCIDNKNFAEQHRISEIKKQIHQVSREIAFWMFENNPEEAYIQQREYQKICEKVADENKNESLEQDFIIGNFYRLKHCEGMGTSELYFVHRTIYEYFVVEYMFNCIYGAIEISKEKLASVFGYFLKSGKLSETICEFLKYKIQSGELNDKNSVIIDALNLMLKDGMTYYTGLCYKNAINCEMRVFANMLEIIHLWNNKDLRIDESISTYLSYNKYMGLNLENIIIQSRINVNSKTGGLCSMPFSGIYLQEAHMAGIQLPHIGLPMVNLMLADLEGADLEGVDLKGANLSITNLMRANLTKAILEQADLSNANLSGAILKEAMLIRADLTDIDLTGADLTKTIFDEKQIECLENKYDLSESCVHLKTGEIINYEEYQNIKGE